MCVIFFCRLSHAVLHYLPRVQHDLSAKLTVKYEKSVQPSVEPLRT